jgi:hypothetical protein
MCRRRKGWRGWGANSSAVIETRRFVWRVRFLKVFREWEMASLPAGMLPDQEGRQEMWAQKQLEMGGEEILCPRVGMAES